MSKKKKKEKKIFFFEPRKGVRTTFLPRSRDTIASNNEISARAARRRRL